MRLKHVDLSWNGFADDGGTALADAITQQESITELNISGNRLNGTAAFALAKALRTNEEIRTLKVGYPGLLGGYQGLLGATRGC